MHIQDEKLESECECRCDLPLIPLRAKGILGLSTFFSIDR